MLVKKHSFIFIFLLSGCLLQQVTHAQCTSPINIFPYDEDFEASDGNWLRSSTAHWEWGQILSKPVITAAGGGSKCWVVGGLTGSAYNSGSSNLLSPCFDLTGLSNPEVSFKIFWETERRYDGVVFQYTTDGGASWQTLGSINSNSTCQGVNWYNYDPVNFLGGPGWSGNIQPTSGSCVGGGGSGGWLTAKHSLAIIAGPTKVSFRFVFAAGLTCNNFDGFAIDDVHIGEAPVNSAAYTFACNGNNAAAFSSTATGCKTGVDWDFGDIPSGINNTSTLDNPTHIFSSTGTYTVVLTTHFATGPDISVAKNINIISANAVITSDIKCNGDKTGAITVTVSPPGTYNYSWDTSPVQSTAAINNLGPGIYTVSITGANTCSVSVPVEIKEPLVLSLTSTVTDAKCGSNNGSITTTVSGGTIPYNYTWSNAQSTASISNLAPGTYSLILKDGNGCIANANNLQVNAVVIPVNVSLGKDSSICPGDKLILSPGNFASYKWQDNSSGATYPVTTTGTYSVTVTDVLGCTGTASIKVTVDCSEIYFPSAFTPNGDNHNDGFGPLPMASLSSVKNYKLTVYGRWGEIIFTSTDPYQRWDGTYKGKQLATQSLTWTATYLQKTLAPVYQKGTVSIIR